MMVPLPSLTPVTVPSIDSLALCLYRARAALWRGIVTIYSVALASEHDGPEHSASDDQQIPNRGSPVANLADRYARETRQQVICTHCLKIVDGNGTGQALRHQHQGGQCPGSDKTAVPV